jgi:hypothetical protein
MVQAIPLQQICDYYYWKHGIRMNQWVVFIIVVSVTSILAFVFYHVIDASAKRLLYRILRV